MSDNDTAPTAPAAPPAEPAAPPEPAELAPAARKSAGRSVWTGAAVGIGSAAIVAALLYTGRKKG